MVQAIRKVAKQVAEGDLKPESITEEHIEKHLFTAGMPHPDLLVRTSGEQRIKLLALAAGLCRVLLYPVLWPDFDAEGLYEAIATFQKRERRFGQTSEQLTVK